MHNLLTFLAGAFVTWLALGAMRSYRESWGSRVRDFKKFFEGAGPHTVEVHFKTSRGTFGVVKEIRERGVVLTGVDQFHPNAEIEIGYAEIDRCEVRNLLDNYYVPQMSPRVEILEPVVEASTVAAREGPRGLGKKPIFRD